MITDRDILDGQKKPDDDGMHVEKETLKARVASILDEFDPVSNAQDRRILYEVTGMRLDKDEFRNEESSGSEDGDEQEELLPSDFLFMYKGHSEVNINNT